MHAPNKELANRVFKAPGEALVWLSSAGLAFGLLMIVGLLGLILVNGITVFWPDRVGQYELNSTSKFTFQGQRTMYGALRKTRDKIVPAGQPPATEIQLNVANRDLYGANLFFVDEADVGSVTYPSDILQIERVEYGNALVFPVALVLKSGERIEASNPAFLPRLGGLVKEVDARRSAIEKVEKNLIGQINSALEDLRLQRKAAATAGPSGNARIATIDAKEIELKGKYETLAAKAGELRAKQGEDKLLFRAGGAKEGSLPVGQILAFFEPNRVGFFSRLGLFFHNIWNFISQAPREANTEGGVFPAIFGTFVMTILMSAAVTPIGVLAAIYLREYAKQGPFVRSVRIAINNLAGVPSIVFGVFGLGFFVYLMGGTLDKLFFSLSLPTPTFGTGGIMWAALTLALMTVPVVIVATEEALASVPRGIREASLACGASKWQTIQRVILPTAVPGILTGVILAMARGAGEVAPLMLVGVVKLAPTLPLDTIWPFLHLERKFMHLGFHIYDLGFQSPDSEAAIPMVYATTLLLIGLVVAMNLAAIVLRERLRRKYKTGAF